MHFDYTIKISIIKIIIEIIIILQKQNLILLIITYNFYIINFLSFINFNFLNYYFNSITRIKIVFIRSRNINLNYYLNETINIKVNQIKISKIRFFRLNKISNSKTSIDLCYQIRISQIRSLRNVLFFVFLKTTIINFNFIVSYTRNNNN